jgi:hypothetical protein
VLQILRTAAFLPRLVLRIAGIRRRRSIRQASRPQS